MLKSEHSGGTGGTGGIFSTFGGNTTITNNTVASPAPNPDLSSCGNIEECQIHLSDPRIDHKHSANDTVILYYCKDCPNVLNIYIEEIEKHRRLKHPHKDATSSA